MLLLPCQIRPMKLHACVAIAVLSVCPFPNLAQSLEKSWAEPDRHVRTYLAAVAEQSVQKDIRASVVRVVWRPRAQSSICSYGNEDLPSHIRSSTGWIPHVWRGIGQPVLKQSIQKAHRSILPSLQFRSSKAISPKAKAEGSGTG